MPPSSNSAWNPLLLPRAFFWEARGRLFPPASVRDDFFFFHCFLGRYNSRSPLQLDLFSVSLMPAAWLASSLHRRAPYFFFFSLATGRHRARQPLFALSLSPEAVFFFFFLTGSADNFPVKALRSLFGKRMWVLSERDHLAASSSSEVYVDVLIFFSPMIVEGFLASWRTASSFSPM